MPRLPFVTPTTYTSDPVIQPDGRQLQIPIVDGWREITERIREHSKAVIQFGRASIRPEQKVELWEMLRPDMSSIIFNSHDEYFQPDPDLPPVGIYSVHPIPELREYARRTRQHNVKLEIKCFTTGAYSAIQRIRSGKFWTVDGKPEQDPGLLADPVWLTIFLGWPGQGWTPPSAKGLQYMMDHLPPNTNWNMSCMDPSVYWSVIANTIALGGMCVLRWKIAHSLNRESTPKRTPYWLKKRCELRVKLVERWRHQRRRGKSSA